MVIVACLIGVARCVDASQCDAEAVLVLSNGSSVWALYMVVAVRGWRGVYLNFFFFFFWVLWDSTRCGEPAIAAPFHSTLPTAASFGICESGSPHLMMVAHVILAVYHSFTNRCHTGQKDRTYHLVSVRMAQLDLKSLLGIIEPLYLSDKQGINNRQMGSVIDNWLSLHVLNTMFCRDGWKQRELTV